MIDHNQADDKIIAVLKDDPAYGDWTDIYQCPPSLIERLRHYFLTYKEVPGESGGVVEIAEVYGRRAAHDVIARSREDYRREVRRHRAPGRDDRMARPGARGARRARLSCAIGHVCCLGSIFRACGALTPGQRGLSRARRSSERLPGERFGADAGNAARRTSSDQRHELDAKCSTRPAAGNRFEHGQEPT